MNLRVQRFQQKPDLSLRIQTYFSPTFLQLSKNVSLGKRKMHSAVTCLSPQSENSKWSVHTLRGGRPPWLLHEPYLWIQIESLQCVDDQGVLRQPVIHDLVEAVQEGRSLNNGFVVRIVETLEATEDKHTLLKGKWQRKENTKEEQTQQAYVRSSAEILSRWQQLICWRSARVTEGKKELCACDYTVTFSVISHTLIKSVLLFEQLFIDFFIGLWNEK